MARPPPRAAAGTLGGGREEAEEPAEASTSPSTRQQAAADAAALQAAASSSTALPYPDRATARLVDVAMLASLGGLAFTLGAVLRLQAYLAYILPLPVAVAAGRWGPAAGVRAASATALLALGEYLVQVQEWLLQRGVVSPSLSPSPLFSPPIISRSLALLRGGGVCTSTPLSLLSSRLPRRPVSLARWLSTITRPGAPSVTKEKEKGQLFIHHRSTPIPLAARWLK